MIHEMLITVPLNVETTLSADTIPGFKVNDKILSIKHINADLFKITWESKVN